MVVGGRGCGNRPRKVLVVKIKSGRNIGGAAQLSNFSLPLAWVSVAGFLRPQVLELALTATLEIVDRDGVDVGRALHRLRASR